MRKEQFIENVKNGIEDLVDRKLNKYDTGIAYKLASKELITYFISDLDHLLQAEREKCAKILKGVAKIISEHSKEKPSFIEMDTRVDILAKMNTFLREQK